MTYPATYYAPGSSEARAVSVTLTPDSLLVNLDAETTVINFPRAGLRMQDSAVSGGPLRVSSPTAPGLLMVSDPALLSAFGRSTKSGSAALAQGLLILTAVAVGLLLGGYFLFLPWFAGVLARRVPASIEQQVGRAALEQLAPSAQRCEDPAVTRPVRAIVDKLARQAPKMDYTFQVFVVKDSTVNALATPGGYIVVYTGLLEKTKSPDELAAVLAHEITHVTGRHSLVGIMRAATFWVLLSYLVGDPTGVLVQAAGALSQLSYQRGQEEEADRGAMRLFEAAHVDPRGLERAFTMLSKELPDVPASARYFSTHPRTEDRLAEIRKWKDHVSYRAEPLLAAANSGVAWPPKGSCGGH